MRESADLGQWLGNKVHKLFSSPLEIVAFSDEEGVRQVIVLEACNCNSSNLAQGAVMQSQTFSRFAATACQHCEVEA